MYFNLRAGTQKLGSPLAFLAAILQFEHTCAHKLPTFSNMHLVEKSSLGEPEVSYTERASEQSAVHSLI